MKLRRKIQEVVTGVLFISVLAGRIGEIRAFAAEIEGNLSETTEEDSVSESGVDIDKNIISKYIDVERDGTNSENMNILDEGTVSENDTVSYEDIVSSNELWSKEVGGIESLDKENTLYSRLPFFYESDDYRICIRKTNGWFGGYQGEIILENISNRTVSEWTVSFKSDDNIVSTWNAICETNEDGYSFTGQPYNYIIKPGECINIGFQVSGELETVKDVSVDLEIENRQEPEMIEEDITTEPYVYVYSNYMVQYLVTSNWEGCCNVDITLRNTSEKKIDNWSLILRSEDELLNSYNAQIIKDKKWLNDNTYCVKNNGFNQDIMPGETVQFGFTVEYGERLNIPESFILFEEEKLITEEEYRVVFGTSSEWDGGSIGNLQIKNLRNTIIEDWTLAVQTESVITDVWGAECSEIGEGIYLFECASYSQNILPGQSVSVGYQIIGNKYDFNVVYLQEKNSIGESVSTDSTSSNSAAQNSVSQDTISENSLSENDCADDGFRIVIDSVEFNKMTNGYYCLEKEVTSYRGHIFSKEKIENISVRVEDAFADTVWEGEAYSDDDFETWSVDNAGFILGGNVLIFTVITNEGRKYEEVIIVLNKEKQNMNRTNIKIADSDFDGIDDYYEKYFRTNPEKNDTDGDSLDDMTEVYKLGLDPSNPDTDGDGIYDADEDNDEDGVTVTEEYLFGTSDGCSDCDGDGLRDGYEVDFCGTNPLIYDTDGDGFSDGKELFLGMNPKLSDSDGNGVPDNEEMIKQIASYQVNDDRIQSVNITLECKGDIDDKVYIYKNNNSIINSTVGIIGVPVNIDVFCDFDNAQISFSYNDTMLGNTDENNLRMMWYKEETDEYILIEDSVVDPETNIVTYNTTHFSTYFLVDYTVWLEETEQEIDYMTYSEKKVTENYDFVVFIDYTVSAVDLAREQTIAKSIIDKMEDGDRLLFLYIKDDSVYQKTSNGKRLWATTKQQAIDNINPNDIWTMFNGNELQPTGNYNGCVELALKAVNFIGNDNNRKLIYLIYPGEEYDLRFSSNYDLMNDNIQIVKNNGDIFNAISLSESASSILSAYTIMSGGKQYTGTDDIIRDSLCKDLEVRIEYEKMYFDATDRDMDGLADIFEIKGMRIPNGNIIYTNPDNPDCDGDTLVDGDEIRYDTATSTFHLVSPPDNADEDGDGILDKDDPDPFTHFGMFNGNIDFEKVDKIDIPYNSAIEKSKLISQDDYRKLWFDRCPLYDPTNTANSAGYMCGVYTRATLMLGVAGVGNLGLNIADSFTGKKIDIDEGYYFLAYYMSCLGGYVEYDGTSATIEDANGLRTYNLYTNRVMRMCEAATKEGGYPLTFCQIDAACGDTPINYFFDTQDLSTANFWLAVKGGQVGISGSCSVYNGVYYLDMLYCIQDYYDFYYDDPEGGKDSVGPVTNDEMAFLKYFGSAECFESCGIYRVIIRWEKGQSISEASQGAQDYIYVGK